MEAPTPIEFTNISHSATGVAIATGTFYEPRFNWQLTAVLTEEEFKVLQGLWYRSELQRRTFRANPGIVLVDAINPYVENSPPTRAIAPGTTANFRLDGLVDYFAVWKVWITSFKASPEGRFHSTAISMIEVARVTEYHLINA
jgi:hypothetical protein